MIETFFDCLLFLIWSPDAKLQIEIKFNQGETSRNFLVVCDVLSPSDVHAFNFLGAGKPDCHPPSPDCQGDGSAVKINGNARKLRFDASRLYLGALFSDH